MIVPYIHALPLYVKGLDKRMRSPSERARVAEEVAKQHAMRPSPFLAFYRALLKGGPQVWWILLLLLLTNPAWLCLQHSRNLETPEPCIIG